MFSEEQQKEQTNLGLGVNALMPEIPPQPDAEDNNDGWFGRPEFYDYSGFELPENYGYDENLLNEFNELAGKYNLSQKGADEIMRLAVKLSQLTGDNYSKINAEQKRAQTENYRNALLTDGEIGGYKLAKAMNTANIAYSHFLDPETQILLQQTGLNCHPGIVKMFYKIGKQMQDDAVLGADLSMPVKENREDILFPTMN